jgi:hypothetical protein
MEREFIGKSLIFIGVIIIIIGVIFLLSNKISWLGHLPGDITIREKNFTFYFPLATSILLSVILSLILMFLGKR